MPEPQCVAQRPTGHGVRGRSWVNDAGCPEGATPSLHVVADAAHLMQLVCRTRKTALPLPL